MAYEPITDNQLARLKQLQKAATITEYSGNEPDDIDRKTRQSKERTIKCILHDTKVCPNHWRIEGTLFEGRNSFKVLAPNLDLAIDGAFDAVRLALRKNMNCIAEAFGMLDGNPHDSADSITSRIDQAEPC